MEATPERSGTKQTMSRGLTLRSSSLDPPAKDKRKYIYKVSLVRTETLSSTTSGDSLPGPDNTPGNDRPVNALSREDNVSDDKPREREKEKSTDGTTKAPSSGQLPRSASLRDFKKTKYPDLPNIVVHSAIYAQVYSPTKKRWRHVEFGQVSGSDSSEAKSQKEATVHNGGDHTGFSSDRDSPIAQESTETDAPNTGLQQNIGKSIIKMLSKEITSQQKRGSTISASPNVNGSPPRNGLQNDCCTVTTKYSSEEHEQKKSSLSATGLRKQRHSQTESPMIETGGSLQEHRCQKGLSNMASVPQRVNSHQRDNVESINKSPQHTSWQKQDATLITESPPKDQRNITSPSAGNRSPPEHTWHHKSTSPGAKLPPRTSWQNTPLSIMATSPPRLSKSSSTKATSPGSPWHNKPSSIMARSPPSHQFLNKYNSTTATSPGGSGQNKPSSIKTTPSQVSVPHNKSSRTMATEPLEIPRRNEPDSRFDFSPSGSPEHCTSNSMVVPSPPESPLLNKRSPPRTPSPLDSQEGFAHTGIMSMSPPGSPVHNKPTSLDATSPPGSPRKNSLTSKVTELVKESPEQCDSSSLVSASPAESVLHDDVFSMNSQSSPQSPLDKTTRTIKTKSPSESNKQEAVRHIAITSGTSDDQTEMISTVSEQIDKTNKDNETNETVYELHQKTSNHIETSNKENTSFPKPSKQNEDNETVVELEPKSNNQYLTRRKITELPPDFNCQDEENSAIAEHLAEISSKNDTSRIVSETTLRNSQNSGSCSGTDSPKENNHQFESTKGGTEPLPTSTIEIVEHNAESSSIGRSLIEEEDNEPTLASVKGSDWPHATHPEINISEQANLANNLEFLIPDVTRDNEISGTCTTVVNADGPLQHTNSESSDILSGEIFKENDVPAVGVPTLGQNDQVNIISREQTPMENLETMNRVDPLVGNTKGSESEAGISSVESGTASSAVNPDPMAEWPSEYLEMENDVPDITSDMESWVDILRSLETPEIMKYARVPRQPRTSPMSVYATLSPIEEDGASPKSSMPLLARCSASVDEEEMEASVDEEEMEASVDEEEMEASVDEEELEASVDEEELEASVDEEELEASVDEEELEMEDVKSSTDMDTSVKPMQGNGDPTDVSEKPKHVFSWEKSITRGMDLEKSSPLEMMRRHVQEDNTQDTRTAGYRSLLEQNCSTRASSSAGTLLLSERLEKKANIPEHKPYSRLNSLLFNSYKGPDKALFGRLEKEETPNNDTTMPQVTTPSESNGGIHNALTGPAKQTSDSPEEAPAPSTAPEPNAQPNILPPEASSAVATSPSSENQDQLDDLLMTETQQSKTWESEDQHSVAQQETTRKNEAQTSDTQEDELQMNMASEDEDTQSKAQENKPGHANVQPQQELSGSPDSVQKEEHERGKLNPRPGKMVIFTEPGLQGEQHEIWGDLYDATGLELPSAISIRVIRGGWVMYEKPRFQGRKIVLEEGDIELKDPWGEEVDNQKEGDEEAAKTPVRIGSLRHVVRDYAVPAISLFHEENGDGKKLKFMDAAYDARMYGQPLKAASIIVHSGLWIVYQEPFFEGHPYILESGGYPTLKAWGGEEPKICSLQPIQIGCPTVEKPYEPKILLFEKSHFEGRSWETNKDICDLKREDNAGSSPLSTVGSLRVLGGCWVGYEKEGFHGHQYLLEEGECRDWKDWGGEDDYLKSIRLIRADFSEPALVLHAEPNFAEGPYLELCNALPDVKLAQYSTTTQSILVHSGVWVAYENVDYSGAQYILEKGTYHSCQDWGASSGQISSLLPILQVGDPRLHYDSQIHLFSQPGFDGDHYIYEEEKGSLPEGFIPQSCRVHGSSWILYEDLEFSGNQYILSEGEYPTHTAMGCLSDTVLRSLMQVPIHFSQPTISLHGLENFEGKEIEFTEEVRSLQAEGFNNHVLSVRVKGGIWVLYEHNDYRGRQWLLDYKEIKNWLEYSGIQRIGSLRPIRQRRIYFHIKNRMSQQFLCIKEEAVEMTAARVLVSEPSEEAQLVWYYEDGRIKNQASPDMSLQVIGAAHKGCKAVLWSHTRKPCQTWRIDPNGHICSQMFEGMILDVKGGETYDRDHVILWTATEERPTQMWTIEVL